MTNDEIRIEVFGVLGWKNIVHSNVRNVILGRHLPTGLQERLPALDLNAMHEAEKCLTEHQVIIYQEMLHQTSKPNPKFSVWHYIHATALQRAEALLRTLGKWR